MKSLVHILNKVFALEFYRLNAAFFLVIISLAGGFMSGVEHQALAIFFINSLPALTIPILCWILHAIKIISFNQKNIHLPENEFIYDLILLRRKMILSATLPSILLQLMPVMIYAAFLIIIAIQNKLIAPILIIILFLIIVIITVTLFFIYSLRNANSENKIWFIKRSFDSIFSRHYIQFFIEWIIRRNAATLIGTKIFSSLLILGITKLYTTDIYDWRLLAIGLTVAFTGNLVVVFYFQRFEEFYLPVLRNLPIPLFKRLLNFTVVFLIICMPELGILVKNFPTYLPISVLVSSIMFSFSILITIYGMLYIHHIMLDKLIQRGFAFSIGIIFVILFNIPLLIVSLIFLTTGIITFNKYYYSYQLKTEE